MPELALRQPECQSLHAVENACVTDQLRTPEGIEALAAAAEVADLDVLAAAAAVRPRGRPDVLHPDRSRTGDAGDRRRPAGGAPRGRRGQDLGGPGLRAGLRRA